MLKQKTTIMGTTRLAVQGTLWILVISPIFFPIINWLKKKTWGERADQQLRTSFQCNGTTAPRCRAVAVPVVPVAARPGFLRFFRHTGGRCTEEGKTGDSDSKDWRS